MTYCRVVSCGGLRRQYTGLTRPPLPGEEPETVAALVLAAGRSTRMGGPNKLLLDFHGEPLIRRTVQNALAAAIGSVVVVTGHESERVRAACDGLAVSFVHNPDFADGLASSLKAGIAATPESSGALVCLGDMPRVRPETLAALVAAHAPDRVVVPVIEGRRGNPVLWGRDHFPALLRLSGDEGARRLIDPSNGHVFSVAVDDAGVLADIDTPADLAASE